MTNNISTPIYDFVKAYAEKNESRFHMPGHKGQAFLGIEQFDITEVEGADSLYEASGIIKESEAYATSIFGTKSTYYATGGSSQCIGAMLYLALMAYKQKQTCVNGSKPIVIAARNAHKAFVHAVALLDLEVVWLWPEKDTESICSCPITPIQVEKELLKYKERVVAVYLTCPDYLGGIQDVRSVAEVCHKHGTLLTVDNAHGAYLHFLEERMHPMDLGADICADSAHKTLPVLTGGAYLHISHHAPQCMVENAKRALGLFGSTSPSYLILSSLDLCNAYLSEEFEHKLNICAELVLKTKKTLRNTGWNVLDTEPLKLVVKIPSAHRSDIARKLASGNVVCEYMDSDYVVFMVTTENTAEDLERIVLAFGTNDMNDRNIQCPIETKTISVCTIREAMLSNGEEVDLSEALGRICRVPTVSCPPAIPIAVPGERITKEMINVFHHYGVTNIDVVKE